MAAETKKETIKVYDDKVKKNEVKPVSLARSMFGIKTIILCVVFLVVSFLNVYFLFMSRVLPHDIYNIYFMLYTITRISYIVLFFVFAFSKYRNDLYNFYTFFTAVELLIVVIYILFCTKNVFASSIISLVFIFSSLSFSKNLFIRKDNDNILANYFMSIWFNVVIYLFIAVFLFYAFQNVPGLKHLTLGIKTLIETGEKVSEAANEAAENTKNAINEAKNTFDNIGTGISDFFNNLGGIFKG